MQAIALQTARDFRIFFIMKTIAVIPARYASTRFPGKPLALIAGKPLIWHVYQKCSDCGVFDEIIVATDDLRIQRAVNSFGCRAMMTSANCVSGTDRVAEVARKTKGGLYVNVQGDGPCITKSELVRCVEAAKESGPCELATTAAPIESETQWKDPGIVKVVCDTKGYALYFSRAPIPAIRDGHWPRERALAHLSAYAYRRENLLLYARLKPSPLEKLESLEMLRALEAGWKIRIVRAAAIHPEVDRPGDIALVESYLRKYGVRGKKNRR